MVKKLIFIIIFLFLSIGSFVFYANKAFLYSSITHRGLTQEMIDLYNLEYDRDLTPKQAELILKGSIDEDILPRPAFHLYDPIYNRAPFGVYTAKTWVLGPGIQTPGILKLAAIEQIFKGTFLHHGDYSWSASVKYYTKNDINEAYYGLGHILHLIEDMTVPAHSRNDHHLMGDPYEQWAKENSHLLSSNLAEELYKNGHKPENVYFLGWALDELAEYSNKYFFSKDTILKIDYIEPKIIEERQEDYGFFMQRKYAWGADENGRMFRVARVLVLDSWEISLLNKDEDNYFIQKDDNLLNQDYWNRLAPKAVVYGAGVIRLFIEEIEEAKKLAQKEPELNWFEKAQLFIKNTLGIKDEKTQEDSQKIAEFIPKILPRPAPARFPDAGLIELVNQVDELNETGGVGESNGSDKVNKSEDIEKGKVLGEEKITEETKKSPQNIVKGPKTGGSGGISWKEAQGIGGEQSEPSDQSEESEEPEESQEESETEPESDPEPEPESEPVIHLVINEIQIKRNEFIEIFNPTDNDISLASYSFCYFSKTRDWNDPYRKKIFSETASISAGGYYLIGLIGYPEEEGNPDADWQIYESRQLSNAAGSVALFPWDPSEKTASEAHVGVIDIVAWGNVENIKEGEAFQESIGEDKTIQRKNNGQDTDDNNTDFELQKIPSPINSNNEEKIPGTFIHERTIISEDTIWTIAGSPYIIGLSSVERPVVAEGVTLTIEPGVVIMPIGGNYTAFEIRGTLVAEGTEDEKIVFTSMKDEEYGGNGSASAGDWMNIVFTSTSIDSSLENVIFRYGGDGLGASGSPREMVRIDGGSIVMENIIIENSRGRGLDLMNSNSIVKNSIFRYSKTGVLIRGSLDTSIIDDCLFENNSEYGLQIAAHASPIIQNNQFINNGRVGNQGAVFLYTAYPEFINNQVTNNTKNGIVVDANIVIDIDTTWRADLPYFFIVGSGESPTIASGSVLTLEPGVVLKGYGTNYTALIVEGTLIAQATSGSEIVITSIKDDSFGGDTNNDGNLTVPVAGDWKNIVFKPSSTGSILDHVFIYYGSSVPIRIEAGADVDIRDTVDYMP